MPIYEYHCSSCPHDFEKLVKLDASTPPCPKCGDALAVAKRVSAASFVLKGGGWYKDHYGLKSSKAESKADASTSSTSSQGSTSSAE